MSTLNILQTQELADLKKDFEVTLNQNEKMKALLGSHQAAKYDIQAKVHRMDDRLEIEKQALGEVAKVSYKARQENINSQAEITSVKRERASAQGLAGTYRSRLEELEEYSDAQITTLTKAVERLETQSGIDQEKMKTQHNQVLQVQSQFKLTQQERADVYMLLDKEKREHGLTKKKLELSQGARDQTQEEIAALESTHDLLEADVEIKTKAIKGLKQANYREVELWKDRLAEL